MAPSVDDFCAQLNDASTKVSGATGFSLSAGRTDMDTDEEDFDLNDEQKLRIIKAIPDAPDDPRSFQGVLDSCLPFALNFTQLQFLHHPDKFAAEHKEAKIAFQSTYSINLLILFLNIRIPP